MGRIHFFYVLGFCFGSLSVSKSHAYLEEFMKKNIIADDENQMHLRQRRATGGETDELKFINEKLASFVRKKVNEVIQEELEKAMEKWMKNFPMKQFCKNIVKCKQDFCKTTKETVISNTRRNVSYHDDKPVTCLPGPRGPPGPMGPPGKEVLGLEAPKLIKSTLDIVANETDDVTFECVFFGNPIPSVEWESKAFDASSKVLNSVDKENSQIVSTASVSNVKWSNRGPVKCKGRSVLGEAVGSGKLSVQAAPVINLQKGPLFVPRGINYQFPECKARAFPKAKITWRRLFWSLPEGRHSTKDGFLNISRVNYDDEGFYICEAENVFGKTEKRVQLKTTKLKMHEEPPPYSDGEITCSAYGNPGQMSGQIMKIDGTKLRPVEAVINKTDNLFSIKALVKKSGTYSCTISFKGEEIKAFTNVKILKSATAGTPKPPVLYDSCKTIKIYNPSATSGVYYIKMWNATKVYCDMETDGGGWTRIGRVKTSTKAEVNSFILKKVLSTNIADLSKAASQNFLLSGSQFPTLQSYIKFHEFRVFCTKVYHGRKHHVTFSDFTTPESKRMFSHVMGGNYHKPDNTCDILKYLPDDNSVTRFRHCRFNTVKESFVSISRRLYTSPWSISEKIDLHLKDRYRMTCDDTHSYLRGSAFGTWLFYVR